MIPCENQQGIVDESIALSAMSRMNSTSATANNTVSTPIAPDVPSYMTILDGISVATAKKLGAFLDGCNVRFINLKMLT